MGCIVPNTPARRGPGDFAPLIMPVPSGPWHVVQAFFTKSVAP